MPKAATTAPAPCWACGSETAPSVEYSPAPLRRCTSCGLLFEPARPAGDVRDLYGDDYFDEYLESLDYDDEPNRRYEARRRAAFLRRQDPPGPRLLEVGAAQGHFLEAARGAGFDPVGIEPAHDTAEATARRLGVEVHAGFLEDVLLEPDSFDAACMWHVLEHIPEPAASMQRLRDVLRPGGVLCIEVPNIDSLDARRDLVDWTFLDLRHHVAHYGPDSLRSLLESAGFEVTHCASFPASAYFRPRKALDPRTLVFYAKQGAAMRSLPRRPHPYKHDLLRAVARVPHGAP